jgi:hypothetical protein
MTTKNRPKNRNANLKPNLPVGGLLTILVFIMIGCTINISIIKGDRTRVDLSQAPDKRITTQPKPEQQAESNPQPQPDPVTEVEVEPEQIEPTPATCDLEKDTPKTLTWNQQIASLDKKVIVIRSYRRDGAYIDARTNGGAYITETPKSTLMGATWAKVIVHHLKDNIVCFESVRFRDAYLDLGPDMICRFTRRNDIPRNEDWARFSIHGVSLADVGIRSERWEKTRWLDAHHSGTLSGTEHDTSSPPTGDWGRFEIMYPGLISSKYVEAGRLSNETNITAPLLFSYTYGVSYQKVESTTQQVELSLEMKKNFGTPLFNTGDITFGARYSNSWSTSSQTTWQESTTSTITINVPANTTYVIKQLEGTYSSFGDQTVLSARMFDYIICTE